MDMVTILQYVLMASGSFFTLFGLFILFHLSRKDD